MKYISLKNIFFFICLLFTQSMLPSSTQQFLDIPISEDLKTQLAYYVNVQEPYYLNTFLNNISSFVHNGQDPRLPHLVALLENLKHPIHMMLKDQIKAQDWILCTRHYESIMWFEQKRKAGLAYLQHLRENFWYKGYLAQCKKHGTYIGIFALGCFCGLVIPK